MRGFMNPIFHPVDNDVSIKERRTFQLPLLQVNQNIELPKEYEHIFSSITDQSQQLNDSLLKPFDNTKYEKTLQHKNDQQLQINQSTQQKNQQPIVKLDKNRLQSILKILANKNQGLKKSKKEQVSNQFNQSKNIKSSNETKQIQINTIANKFKNNPSRKHLLTINQDENDLKSLKQRSSTNYTPRVETSLITTYLYSSKNLDTNLNNKQDDINIIQLLQRRAKSQYHPKQLIKYQIDEINQKIEQLKNLIFKSIKYDPLQESIQTSINKIIQQNEDSNLLQKEIQNIKDFINLKSFKEQKYYIYFNILKLISLAKEKQKKLQIIMIFTKEGGLNDSNQSPKVNYILSRQTTSDNIIEEIQEDKRKFFQLVVNRKLDLPFNHPSKDLLLNQLYQKALQLGVKKSNWQQFLINELKF